MDSLERYWAEIREYPLLSPDEERRLAEAVRAAWLAGENPHSSPAWNTLVTSNLRLVASIARDFVGISDLDFLDLVQEGSIGLIRAIDRFDPGRGFKLSTYGTYWIRQCLQRAVADKGRMIRLPVHMHDRVQRARRAASSGENNLSDDIAKLLLLDRRPMSLDFQPGPLQKTMLQLMEEEGMLAAEQRGRVEDLSA